MNIDDQHNELFRADKATARLAPVLRDCLQATSRLGFSLTPADLAEIDAGEEQALALVGSTFAMMREQATARRRNLEAFAGVEVVSIGQDCFSRTVLTRWGLKKFAALGEKSGPFDLSVHPIPTTIELIESDFAGYMNPDDLVFNKRLNYCQHLRTGTHFNHETGPEHAENGFAQLIGRYEARIAHFRAVMASDRPTALVLHYCHPEEDGTAESIARLWRTIEARWGGAGKHLISVNTWPHGSRIEPVPSACPGSVTVIDVAYPTPGYVWHKPDCSFSQAGCAFEREVVERVKDAASPLLPRIAATAA